MAAAGRAFLGSAPSARTGIAVAASPAIVHGEIDVIIDWHGRIYTPEEAAGDLGTLDGKMVRMGRTRLPMVLENFLEAHHANGIDIKHRRRTRRRLPRGKADREELAAVQKWSDYAAEVQEKHKGTLYSFATILAFRRPRLSSRRPSVRSRELGLSMFIIPATRVTIPMTTRRLRWELVQEVERPVMIHPPISASGRNG